VGTRTSRGCGGWNASTPTCAQPCGGA